MTADNGPFRLGTVPPNHWRLFVTVGQSIQGLAVAFDTYGHGDGDEDENGPEMVPDFGQAVALQ